MYHGDIRLGDTLDLKFTTRRFTTGAPFTLAGSPVISAYVGNSTTEITAGITLTVDFDSRTGLNNVRVVATSGNGYATASNVDLVITTGTVDSVSVVGEVVASFSIEARSALMAATAGRTLVVDAAGLADANMVKVGPTGSGTAQTAGDIMADTNDIQTRLPAALVGGRMDSSVGAIAANAITAASIATDAIDGDAISASAVTEIQTGMATSASITTLQTSVDDLPTNAELATALAVCRRCHAGSDSSALDIGGRHPDQRRNCHSARRDTDSRRERRRSMGRSNSGALVSREHWSGTIECKRRRKRSDCGADRGRYSRQTSGRRIQCDRIGSALGP